MRYRRFHQSTIPETPAPPSAPALSSGCLLHRSFRSSYPAPRRAARGTLRARPARRNTRTRGMRFPSVSTISRRPTCHFAGSPVIPAIGPVRPKRSHRNIRAHHAGRLFRPWTAGFCFSSVQRAPAAPCTAHSGTGCTRRGSAH